MVSDSERWHFIAVGSEKLQNSIERRSTPFERDTAINNREIARYRLRDILIFVLVAAAFVASLAMIRRIVGFGSPWFGVAVMLDVLGLVAIGRRLFVLKLPGSVRRLRPWETQGAIYKALRVPAFGTLLRRTPLRSLNPMVYLSPQADGLVVIAQLESAEMAHFLAAAVLMPYIAYACFQGWTSAVAWLLVLQIAGNVYPILHLRWSRIRLQRLHAGNRSSGRSRRPAT